jgi:class 3 adenylate cyclase
VPAAVVATEESSIGPPEVRYARSGDVAIAYQVVGDGPLDLVFVPWLSNLAYAWEHPPLRDFYEQLASFARLVLLDKRGTGLSDRPRDLPTIETRMDDLRAVLDAVGSERAALLGAWEGGQMCAVFAATYPERTSALVLYDTPGRYLAAPDYPLGVSEENAAEVLRRFRDGWGTRAVFADMVGEGHPAMTREEFEHWYITLHQLAVSPGAAVAFQRMFIDTDIRDVLSTIKVPTLVIGRARKEISRDTAARIPNAKFISVPGEDVKIYLAPGIADAVRDFLAGKLEEPAPDRVLATVLFTDIVASSSLVADLGDRRWRELLGRHNQIVRRQLARFHGTERDTAGDGFFATFDGPGRAIECARATRAELLEAGLTIRAGVHTGECEAIEGKVAGIAVNIGARVAAQAGPAEILATRTVRDLVAGSGLRFDDRGQHELKGIPEAWQLFRVLD